MKKIMIVDDEQDQIATFEYVVQSSKSNYEIISVNDGMQCLQLLKNNQIPDLILLDIMMPKMSGWEVFKRIKEIPSCKDVPIIFLTARTDVMAKKAGSFLGDDYIEKPFDSQNLLKRINEVLENK
jgi:DNA-binding response OmpR family regulator